MPDLVQAFEGGAGWTPDFSDTHHTTREYPQRKLSCAVPASEANTEQANDLFTSEAENIDEQEQTDPSDNIFNNSS